MTQSPAIMRGKLPEDVLSHHNMKESLTNGANSILEKGALI